MIGLTVARLLVRIHANRPIGGRVLTLGRQTIGLTLDEARAIFREEGVPVAESPATSNIDTNTRYGRGTNFISDAAFFGLFGVTDLSAMDVSSYEAAEILHNLNDPVPEQLHGQFDFIVDGGTFDHLYDLRAGFENVARMLKTGGRVLQWNAASNYTGGAYVSFGPDLFADYYTINRFSACEVYLAELDSPAQPENWSFYRFDGLEGCGFFQSNHVLLVLAYAEKAADSTWDKMPIQAHYRDADVAELYRAAQSSIRAGQSRPLISVDRVQPPRLTSKSAGVAESVSFLAAKTEELGLLGVAGKARARITERVKRGLGLRKRIVKGFDYVGKV